MNAGLCLLLSLAAAACVLSGSHPPKPDVADDPAPSVELDPLVIQVICEYDGKLEPRGSEPVIDAGAGERVGRSVIWIVGKDRVEGEVALVNYLIRLAEQSRQERAQERAGALQVRRFDRVKIVAGPRVRWSDIFVLFERLPLMGSWNFDLPGSWRRHPYQIDAVSMPPTDDGLIVAPLRGMDWIPSTNPPGRFAELEVLQDGKVRFSGAIVFDPHVDRDDRRRVRELLRDLGARAKDLGEVEEADSKESCAVATSRILLHADRWVEWKWLYLLMKDLTEADPAFPSFDIAVAETSAR